MTNRRPTPEENARFLAAIEASKRWDREDELRWRNATDRERNRALMQILLLGEQITKSRDFKRAEDEERFPGLKRGRVA